MAYAVELYFDPQSEKRVSELIELLNDHGIEGTMSELAARPHISLAVITEADEDELLACTAKFAQTIQQFQFQLAAIGAFPTKENVVLLSPVVTHELLACHDAFHQHLAAAGIESSPYYTPGNWIPHCTVEMNFPDEKFTQAIELLKTNFEAFSGDFLEVGVIAFRPIKYLKNWPLH